MERVKSEQDPQKEMIEGSSLPEQLDIMGLDDELNNSEEIQENQVIIPKRATLNEEQKYFGSRLTQKINKLKDRLQYPGKGTKQFKSITSEINSSESKLEHMLYFLFPWTGEYMQTSGVLEQLKQKKKEQEIIEELILSKTKTKTIEEDAFCTQILGVYNQLIQQESIEKGVSKNICKPKFIKKKKKRKRKKKFRLVDVQDSIRSVANDEWVSSHFVSVNCEPVIEILGVTLHKENASSSLLKVRGDIYVQHSEDDGSGSIYLYRRCDGSEISDGPLSLTWPDEGISAMAKPQICLKIHDIITNVSLLNGSASLVEETSDNAEEDRTATIRGTDWSADVDYLELRFGVFAYVVVQLEKEGKEEQLEVYGSISAEYTLFFLQRRVQCITLFEITEDSDASDCVKVGSSIAMSRSFLACPAYSSLKINVNLKARNTKGYIVKGSANFQASNADEFSVIHGSDNLDARVICYWEESRMLRELHASETTVPLWIDSCLTLTPWEVPARNLVEVFSLFICRKNNKQLNLSGMVSFSNCEGYHILFRRDKNNPFILPSNCNLLPMEGPSYPLVPQEHFFVSVELEDSDNNVSIKGFVHSDPRLDRQRKPWYDRLLSCVIKGANDCGFAVVHYTVFASALMASLKVNISIEGEISSHTKIYGSLIAHYSGHGCKTNYERYFHRVVLFKREKEYPIKISSKEFDLELLRYALAVPYDSTLLISAKITYVSSSGVQIPMDELLEIKLGEENVATEAGEIQICVDVKWGTYIRDRTADWNCSVQGKDSSGKRTISDSGTKRIADAGMEWRQKEVVGASVPEGDKDALTMVLGKDHNGRVRGKGGIRLGKKKAFVKWYKASRFYPSTKLAEEIKSSIEKKLENKKKNQLTAILQHLGLPSFDELLEKTARDNGSQRDPTTPVEPPEEQRLLLLDVETLNPDLEEKTLCDLLLLKSDVAENPLNVVAHGSAQAVYEDQKEWIKKANAPHSKDVDSRATEKEDDPQAKEIVVNSHEKGEKEESQQKLSSKGSTHHLTPSKTPLVTTKVLNSLSEACTWLHTCVISMPDAGMMIVVELDKFQFHYLFAQSVYITREDVREFLSRDMLCASIIQAFMRALYEDLILCESVSKVGWLCPLWICDIVHKLNQPELQKYLSSSLDECCAAGNKFILAPYHHNMHWMLLVICPSSYTIYEFDSSSQEQQRNFFITALLNSAMRKLCERSSNPHWKFMRCARQQNGVECGYYVMRYMYDLVSSCSEVDHLEQVFNTPREEPFTVKEIDEVRDKLALFLTNNCF